MPHVKHKQPTTTTTDRQTGTTTTRPMRLRGCQIQTASLASCLYPDRTLLYQNNNKHMPELCLVFCCCNSTFKQLNTHAEIGGTKSGSVREERGASLCLPAAPAVQNVVMAFAQFPTMKNK